VHLPLGAAQATEELVDFRALVLAGVGFNHDIKLFLLVTTQFSGSAVAGDVLHHELEAGLASGLEAGSSAV
jgi:hypothetical protein